MNLHEFFDFTLVGLFCLAVLLLNATPRPDTVYIDGECLADDRQADPVLAAGMPARPHQSGSTYQKWLDRIVGATFVTLGGRLLAVQH